MKIPVWLLHLADKYGPARRLIVAKGDSMPERLPWRNLVLTRDDDEDWSVGMRCPCGCDETIELMIAPEAKPNWTVQVDAVSRPTLHPSVWRQKGCRSHFWMRAGRIRWCD